MRDDIMPNLSAVREAAGRIYQAACSTPLVRSPELIRLGGGGCEVFLKLELLQPTGSFKIRGAMNRIASLGDEQKRRGVITFSTGNHGRAVSLAAAKQGIPAVVCLSKRVPGYRVEAIRELGGEPVVTGASQDEAEKAYYRIAEERGLTPVVPFDDPAVIAGQGTIALEALRQYEQADTLIVPLSGGGLLAGIAMTAKELNPSIRVIGVSIDRSPAMLESLKAGKPVAVEEQDTLADSLLGGIGRENRYTMQLISSYVDDHVLVSEDDVRRGMHFCFRYHSLVAEGAGCVGIGAILSGVCNISGRRVILPVTGGNVDRSVYLKVMMQEEVHAHER